MDTPTSALECVRALMPGATEEQLQEAAVRFDRYIELLCRIALEAAQKELSGDSESGPRNPESSNLVPFEFPLRSPLSTEKVA